VYDPKRGKKVFITEKVLVSSTVYVMKQVVIEDNVSYCYQCLGTGTYSGTRWELVRKKGLRGNDQIGYYGYRDAEGPYHLVHEKVRYSEQCFHCGGSGKKVFKGSKSCFELIPIVL
jgi:hypothetical protein